MSEDQQSDVADQEMDLVEIMDLGKMWGLADMEYAGMKHVDTILTRAGV